MDKPQKNLHVKPSKEQLQAGIDASLKELETIPPDPPTPPAPVTPPVVTTPPVPVTPPVPIVPPAPVKPPEPTTPPAPVTPPAVTTPPVAPVVTPPGEIDWKAKFQASQRESMVQGFKSKEIQNAYELAAKVPVPSNEEMKKEYPDWDDMDSTTQKIAMENLLKDVPKDIAQSIRLGHF